MEIVRDVKSFVEKNGKQLQKFFTYKTGINDREMIHEHLQDFYVRMIQTKALEHYRENKGSFDTYISTLLCWLLPYKAKKNVSVQYAFITRVRSATQTVDNADDIWDHMGTFNGPYRIDFSPCTPRVFDDESESTFNQYLEEFKSYIRETESRRSARQMIVFLDCKQTGGNSSDVAAILGVTDNMAKIIKQKLQKKFERWKTLN
jgi:hypothetical protein